MIASTPLRLSFFPDREGPKHFSRARNHGYAIGETEPCNKLPKQEFQDLRRT